MTLHAATTPADEAVVQLSKADVHMSGVQPEFSCKTHDTSSCLSIETGLACCDSILSVSLKQKCSHDGYIQDWIEVIAKVYHSHERSVFHRLSLSR